VRELENAMENAVVMTENNWIKPEDLPFYIKPRRSGDNLTGILDLDSSNYKEQLEIAEKMIIEKALQETDGNKTHAAKRLGFSIRTMRNKVKKYGI
jgi:DNA-binding NtrC family response regulator